MRGVWGLNTMKLRQRILNLISTPEVCTLFSKSYHTVPSKLITTTVKKKNDKYLTPLRNMNNTSHRIAVSKILLHNLACVWIINPGNETKKIGWHLPL